MSIGLLILGHNEFATGLLSALNALYGPSENLIALDYSAREGEEVFSIRLEKALEELNCQSFLALVDLAGSVPYKQACAVLEKKGAIVAGVNLGMVLEINEMRQFVDDLEKLVEKALLVGKEQIISYPKIEEEDG